MFEVQDRIYALLCELVTLTETWTRTRPQCFQATHNNPLAFAKEYRTVRFGSARMIGHTTAGLRLANADPNCSALFLVLRQDMIRSVRDIGHQLNLGKHVQLNYVSSENWQNRPYGLVIVDCAAFLSHGNQDKVYALARDVEHCPLFVFLE